MRLSRSIVALGMAACMAAPLGPALGQDAKVDIRKIPCGELDQVEDGDRIAAIFFFYGFHAALLNAYEVTPANLERNVRNVVDYCQKNPGMAIFDAMPKAFQR